MFYCFCLIKEEVESLIILILEKTNIWNEMSGVGLDTLAHILTLI